MAVVELPSRTAFTPALASSQDASGTVPLPKSQQKGQQTKAAIVDAALGLATQIGLEGLSIGVLAEVMRMSKSGVFAHFGSREDLQIEVLKLYHHHFEQEVFYPSMKDARGLPRLQSMFSRWVRTASWWSAL